MGRREYFRGTGTIGLWVAFGTLPTVPVARAGHVPDLQTKRACWDTQEVEEAEQSLAAIRAHSSVWGKNPEGSRSRLDEELICNVAGVGLNSRAAAESPSAP
ncbi:hypothetical protein JOQ06_000663, partial [Pogonophryne albipinna]